MVSLRVGKEGGDGDEEGVGIRVGVTAARGEAVGRVGRVGRQGGGGGDGGGDRPEYIHDFLYSTLVSGIYSQFTIRLLKNTWYVGVFVLYTINSTHELTDIPDV